LIENSVVQKLVCSRIFPGKQRRDIIHHNRKSENRESIKRRANGGKQVNEQIL